LLRCLDQDGLAARPTELQQQIDDHLAAMQGPGKQADLELNFIQQKPFKKNANGTEEEVRNIRVDNFGIKVKTTTQDYVRY